MLHVQTMKDAMETKDPRSVHAAWLCLRVLHPCHRRAGTQIHTEGDTDGQRCTEHQEAPSSETASPLPGHHQGTSPSRDCEGEGGGGGARKNISRAVCEGLCKQ